LKRQLLVGIISISFLVVLDGCTHYYYAPNQHNVPLFKEKNEVRLSGAYIQGSEINGCDIQAGYAATKEFAVIANALVINPTSKDGKGQLYEVGGGYYKPIPSSCPAISKKFVFETYSVFGLGSATNYYGNYPYNVSTDLFKAYLQPSIGFTTNLFDVILSQKIGLLHTFNVKKNMPDTTYNNLVQNGSSVVNDLNILNQGRTSFFFEPAFTFRIGFKYVKFHFQVGASLISGDFRQLTISPVYDYGVTIFIGRRFWQKDDRPKKEKWKEVFD
jgi:hypothetical protein